MIIVVCSKCQKQMREMKEVYFLGKRPCCRTCFRKERNISEEEAEEE